MTVTVDHVAPTVTSTAPTTVKKGQNLNYNVESSAEGPDADQVYRITEGPAGAAIDAKTGVVSWTPSFSLTTPSAAFKVEVQDVAGNAISHDFTVNVVAADRVVGFTVQVEDLQGNPLAAIAKGSEFQVKVLVSDLRRTDSHKQYF